MEPKPPWGLMAEFGSAEALLAAVQSARAAGYRHVEARAPVPVEGLDELLDPSSQRLAWRTGVGALGGGLAGGLVQWWSAAGAYPPGIAALPSWWALLSAPLLLALMAGLLTLALTLLLGAGVPTLALALPGLAGPCQASDERFMLCLRADDPAFEPTAAAALLDALTPLRRLEVHR